MVAAQTPLPDEFDPGADGLVRVVAVQVDGKVLMGGDFTTVAGQPRRGIARVNADGTLDTGFNPGADGPVYSVAVQKDGKILVGGWFTTLSGQPRKCIGRLKADGTLDAGFGAEANNYVYCLALQADGKILVGGWFSTLGGQPCNHLGRLNTDGTVEAGFNPVTDQGYSADVETLAIQPDGKILVGGKFGGLGGQSRWLLGRLNADGTLDAGFDAGLVGRVVDSLALQADGKILLGGEFTALREQSRTNIARVNPDGTPDAAFNPGASGGVYSLAVQADGKIVAAGSFTRLGGQPRSNIGRLNADGILDTEFNPQANSSVYSLAVQADGRILAGGGFTSLGGEVRSRVARLHNTAPATQGLAHDGSTVTWLRGGTSPEVWRTTFEHSTDGSFWTSLGAGVRIPDGWQVPGLAIPSRGTLRAHGHVTAGGGASDWFVESMAGQPAFDEQPSSRTNNAGTDAQFSVYAGGNEPLSYRWRKNGAVLVDAGNVSGTMTPALSVDNVLKSDEGAYSVVVSNAEGSVTSRVATLTVVEPVITSQPVSQIADPGRNLSFTVTAVGTPPLSYQWWKDGVAMAQGTGATLDLANVQTNDIGLYTVAVTNRYGSVTSAVAGLTVNLTTLDPEFVGTGGGIPMALQPDGKILMGGDSPGWGEPQRPVITRLNANGTPDATFSPGSIGCCNETVSVDSMALQSDRKILVGGGTTFFGEQPTVHIIRVNSDGSYDAGFHAAAGRGYGTSLAVQADGNIVLGGTFVTIRSESRVSIARLTADGTLDPEFNPGADSYVTTVAVQADGQILVGGGFSTLAGQAHGRIGRLTADGTVDEGFAAEAGGGEFPAVSALTVQADGKILVGGWFTTLNGQPRNRIGRLNTDGTLDAGFDPNADASVYSLAVQADGKILVAGWFTTLGGQPRNRIARLNADGTLDMVFGPGAEGGAIYSLALQADGKILVAGSFTNLNGQARPGIARLNNIEPATQCLTFECSTITWLRGGTSPEVWRTTFEHSADGSNWVYLGAGTRIPGGWQLSGVTLPPRGTLCARGHLAGGYHNGSCWFVESMLGPPVFQDQPDSRTNHAGTTATFSVLAGGTEPLSFQWYKDGVPLTDGVDLIGAATSTLTVSNVSGADAGGYSVAVSNVEGSMISTVATLTVIDVLITAQPVSQIREPGQSVSFSVVVTGTPPLAYQWRKDGIPLAQATDDVLEITNVQTRDTGLYTVLISNPSGSVTSAVAELTVSFPTLDVEFNPGPSGSFAQVYSLAVQADGKILVGGAFTALGGLACSNIGRLNIDGTVDVGFNPTADAYVYSVAVQPDDRILVAGRFTSLGGQPRSFIGRLHADGTLDAAFHPSVSSYVTALAVQADGKILVGGGFTTLGGQPRRFIGRLLADGTLDAGFNPGASSYVNLLGIQADGKILVGGGFSSLGGQLRTYIGRLNANGTADTAFKPAVSSYVHSLAVQADGKILLGGTFARVDGQPRVCIARLHANGTLDSEFNPMANSDVDALAVQADGKILVGGRFTTLGGQPHSYMAQLHPDGTPDPLFDPAARGGPVSSLTLQPDGKILAIGGFTKLGGYPRQAIARLNHAKPATQNLSWEGSTVTWLRGGSSPEVVRTTFEHSADGYNWTNVGAGTRIPGGWQLSGPALPPNGTIRARGHVAGAFGNGSCWFVETSIFAPWPIRLNLVRDGAFGILSWTGGQGPYQVQQTPHLGSSDAWENVGEPVQTNSISLPIGTGTLFLRVRGP